MKTKCKTLLLFGLALAMMAGPSAQAFELLVPDFRVDQGQVGAEVGPPAIAVAPNQTIIISWADNRNGNWDIFTRRLDGMGRFLGDDFRVGYSDAPSLHGGPAVAVQSNNRFVISWTGALDIYARRFDQNGNPLGDSILVMHTDLTGHVADWPAIAIEPNEGFIISWHERWPVYCLCEPILGRRYDAQGNPLIPYDPIEDGPWAGTFQVNGNQLGSFAGIYPSFAINASAHAFFVWADFRGIYDDGDEGNIYARYYDSLDNLYGDSLGNLPGIEWRMDQEVGVAEASHPKVAKDPNQRFIITWSDQRSGNWDIYGRRYDATANPLGNEFRVDADPGSANATLPSLAASSDRTVISWTDDRDGREQVYARLFDASGAGLGNDFRVNRDRGANLASSPAVVYLGGSSFIFVWQDDRNGNRDIYASIWGEWTDADNDGLPDLYEQRYSCLQANTVDHSADPDGDGYTNLEEFQNGTDPCVSDCADADGDGFGPGCLAGPDCDDADPDNWISCAACADDDGDAYFSGCDAYTTRSGPDCEDHAAGIFPGAPELCDCIDNQCPGDAGYGVVDEGCTPDADCDGMPDDWEKRYDCMDPTQADALSDYDADGLSNHAEYSWGLDPCEADTDDDDLADGEELDLYRTDPLNRDTDGDGYNDGTEVKEGTDPLDPASYPNRPDPNDAGLQYSGGGSSRCGQLADGPAGAGVWWLATFVPWLIREGRRAAKKPN